MDQHTHATRMMIDYVKVEQRWAQYMAAGNKTNLLSLVENDHITQANTEGCQCRLLEGDHVWNFVEDVFVAGGLAGMLPPGSSWLTIVNEVYVGDQSLAALIHRASDERWANVIAAIPNH